MMQKYIKAAACRKAGCGQQWAANVLLQRCPICFYADKQQKGSRVLKHFLGSIAAGTLCSVGWSWKPQAKKSGWSLSRPQGFQNMWYPWLDLPTCTHCFLPMPSTPFQKSHNCFCCDSSVPFSEGKHAALLDYIWCNDSVQFL